MSAHTYTQHVGRLVPLGPAPELAPVQGAAYFLKSHGLATPTLSLNKTLGVLLTCVRASRTLI